MPVKFRCALVVALLGAGTSLVAQTQLTPDAFLDQAVGKTLTFSTFGSGRLVGVEQFLRRDLSVWAGVDLRCTYGEIEVRGPLVCFIYENNPNPENCWMPFVDDQGLIVMSRSFDIQRVTAVTQNPVVCNDAPTS